MIRGLFITGTDTNVGKTVVSAALLRRFRGAVPLTYWKPIQTGIEQDDDTAQVRRWSACAEREILADGVRLRTPVSPHLAARRAGVVIDVARLLAMADGRGALIVEGAGGVLVPLNDADLMIDLMARLGLAVLIVTRSGLGTINHTLLTLAALRSRSLQVAGVVMVGQPDSENRLAIERFGRTRVVGELPMLTPLTPDALGRWADGALDPEGRLLEYLR